MTDRKLIIPKDMEELYSLSPEELILLRVFFCRFLYGLLNSMSELVYWNQPSITDECILTLFLVMEQMGEVAINHPLSLDIDSETTQAKLLETLRQQIANQQNNGH